MNRPRPSVVRRKVIQRNTQAMRNFRMDQESRRLKVEELRIAFSIEVKMYQFHILPVFQMEANKQTLDNII